MELAGKQHLEQRTIYSEHLDRWFYVAVRKVVFGLL
jgi:hypothetical protein